MYFYRAVYEATDTDLKYDVIYLDFSKAFDRVPHKRLLTKVKTHGVDGIVYKEWQKQRAQINGKKSNWGTVNSGVPQGRYLAHYFFLSVIIIIIIIIIMTYYYNYYCYYCYYYHGMHTRNCRIAQRTDGR